MYIRPKFLKLIFCKDKRFKKRQRIKPNPINNLNLIPHKRKIHQRWQSPLAWQTFHFIIIKVQIRQSLKPRPSTFPKNPPNISYLIIINGNMIPIFSMTICNPGQISKLVNRQG